MAASKFTVPNWGQAQLAKCVGLDPGKMVVSLENDQLIVFLQHMPRKEYILNKVTGKVQEH